MAQRLIHWTPGVTDKKRDWVTIPKSYSHLCYCFAKKPWNTSQWELECKETYETCQAHGGNLVCFHFGKLGHMVRECTSMPLSGPLSGDMHFEAQMYWNDPKDNGSVEMMDCSLGKSNWEEKKEKPMIWANVEEKKIQALIHTSCDRTLNSGRSSSSQLGIGCKGSQDDMYAQTTLHRSPKEVSSGNTPSGPGDASQPSGRSTLPDGIGLWLGRNLPCVRYGDNPGRKLVRSCRRKIRECCRSREFWPGEFIQQHGFFRGTSWGRRILSHYSDRAGQEQWTGNLPRAVS